MTTSLAPHPLLIPPDLAKEIGLHEAVILQQIHYWLERSTYLINGCHWIYNTYRAWQQQFPFLSLSAIRRAIARLEGLKLLKTERFDKQSWNQTKWYSINYQRLEVFISSICSEQPHRVAQFEQLDVTNLSSSSTKTKTITTSENTSPQSEERGEEKLDKAIVVSCWSSSSAKDESVSDKQADSDWDRFSAPSDLVENDFDGLPCSNAPTVKPDLSASTQTNRVNQRVEDQDDSNGRLRITAPSNPPVFESSARTELLTRLSALTTESVDSLRLNTILNSALDRYPERANNALEYFQQALATWKNKPGMGLFIHAVKSGQKPSLTKPGCGWKEWADEAIKRRLMQYSHSQDGDIMVHFVGGGQSLWSRLRGLSWAEIERVARGEDL
jgi:hypothetical protein